ncbi:transposable element Tcb2 transposase [Trichonephila clavipes]|nr:transposable element Tcb2 transposase [Trichonephila clavipes]
MSTDPGKRISNKLSFQKNHASICGNKLVAFVLDAKPVKAAFQSMLSNDIVTLHPKLRFEMQFRIMDDPIYNELGVIPIVIAQCMLFFPWPAYSPDMPPIERVWDLAGWRDLRPAASKDVRLLHIQAMCNSLPQSGIQNLFDSMSHRIVALIA